MKRTSGVLMHISSLWGEYSSGSFGKNAREWIDFLKDCGIDQLSIASVFIILSKVVEDRGEYFPNAATCFTETLLNLLTLLFSGDNLSPISANMADKWMFVLYYQEDRIWNKDHHAFQNVNCISYYSILYY